MSMNNFFLSGPIRIALFSLFLITAATFAKADITYNNTNLTYNSEWSCIIKYTFHERLYPEYVDLGYVPGGSIVMMRVHEVLEGSVGDKVDFQLEITDGFGKINFMYANTFHLGVDTGNNRIRIQHRIDRHDQIVKTELCYAMLPN